YSHGTRITGLCDFIKSSPEDDWEDRTVIVGSQFRCHCYWDRSEYTAGLCQAGGRNLGAPDRSAFKRSGRLCRGNQRLWRLYYSVEQFKTSRGKTVRSEEHTSELQSRENLV